MRAVSVIVVVAGVSSCGDASVVVEFGAAPREFGWSLQTTPCNLATDNNECRLGGPEPFTFSLTPNEAREPGNCRFNMSITVDCAAPTSQLLAGEIQTEALTSREPTVVDFTAFSRGFANDFDGFSNYLEWAEGSALDDPGSVPADRQPDL